ncbi:hypothetical protein DFQ29_006844 [Apophysomyces sp. BC1021]|nr:hypothetical protein DFQ29_006844 [Apophysomyces sp. BC1021]
MPVVQRCAGLLSSDSRLSTTQNSRNIDMLRAAAGKALASMGLPLDLTNDFMESLSSDSQGDYEEQKDFRFQVKARYVLTPVQQALFVKAYPHVNFVGFEALQKGSPSLAACAREIDTDLLLDRSCPDDFVIDIGGDFSAHAIRGRMNVYTCSPELKEQDRARNRERRLKLSDRLLAIQKGEHEENNPALTHYSKSPEHFYCNNSPQDCKVSAVISISVYSAYDITLEQ